jgi:hypothetical protein
MKLLQPFLLVFLMLGFISCSNQAGTDEDPFAKENEAIQNADKLLEDIAGSPQIFSISSTEPSTVTGSKGTIVKVDPAALESLDSSPLGAEIKVELRELTEPGELIANRTPTVSGERLLETGGAYYINMSSDGKPLRIKEGEGLMVEFPRLSEEGMELFIGQRSHGGMVEWSPLEEKIAPKDLEKPQMSKIEEMLFGEQSPKGGKPQEIVADSSAVGSVNRSNSDIQDIITFLGGNGKSQPPAEKASKTMSKEEQRKARAAYQKQLKEFEVRQKTYEAVRMVNLGWMNCDRFIEDESPRTDLLLTSTSDILIGRAFAVFYKYNSLMYAYFQTGEPCENCEDQAVLSHQLGLWKIPVGQKVKIVAIGSKEGSAQYFESDVTIAEDQALEVKFAPLSQVDLERKLVALNRIN